MTSTSANATSLVPSATSTLSSLVSSVTDSLVTSAAAATDIPPPYVPILSYNNSPSETGGDSLIEDLTIYYDTDVSRSAPSNRYFYSGLARRKSALSLILLSMFSTGIVGFQWVLWGYSLTFSHSGGPFIGTLENIGFRNVLGQPCVGSPKVPDLLFAIYQGMFAAITPALAVGAATDRGRLLPACVFIFVWATLIYDPIAFWAWNPKGWLAKLGYLDFAGGTPVHMAAGSAALAYSVMLGKRHGYNKVHGLPYRPHNVTHVILGTVFLWVGWFGFNGGSALSASMRAIMACVVTHTAASVSAMTWCFMDMRLDGKMSAVGFCSGAVVGLVAITPGSGFVPVWASIIFGVVVGVISNLATKLKYYMSVDDSIDIFASHCVAGFVGNVLTAFFAADYIAHLDGYTSIKGGWLNGHYIQLGYQLAGSAAGLGYSFIGTCVILFFINLIPGLTIRCDLESEIGGLDAAECGEFAYDYVEVTRESPMMDIEGVDGGSSAGGDTLAIEKMAKDTASA
ncbi:hypothetical protein FGG08_006468 [Glutinoglossum americanum]|uniref:Ammonium transporter n=1 Tax=Glutinoglossum americanum TaxID=1670608 RepID=A0A9P8HY89_9PEZI|nr:hypothetical protein FGG08_006468 [Glutinoglossum americanum]